MPRRSAATGPPAPPWRSPLFPSGRASRSRCGLTAHEPEFLFPITNEDDRFGAAWKVQVTYARVMPGAVALVVAMLVVLPAALFAAGGVWSALLGASLTT